MEVQGSAAVIWYGVCCRSPPGAGAAGDDGEERLELLLSAPSQRRAVRVVAKSDLSRPLIALARSEDAFSGSPASFLAR